MIPHMTSSDVTSDFRIYKTAKTKRKSYGLCGSCRLQGVLCGPAGAGSCSCRSRPAGPRCSRGSWPHALPGPWRAGFCSSLVPWSAAVLQKRASAAGPPSCFHRHSFCVHIRPFFISRCYTATTLGGYPMD